MIAPTLLVGLGGTGSKIVMKVSKMVDEEQRKRIGFCVFDTDINELTEIREANPFIKTVQTSTKLSVGEYLNIDTHARDTWFPVNAILNSKTLTEGAGQVRAISRLALDTAIRAGNMEPLHKAIEDLYKLEEERSEQALRVIIVSSLAGGTGSGLLLPVALYIKNFLATRFQQSANITRGFFILPEVFYEVIRGQAERNNLRCNAYATIRELDAFLMKGDSTLDDKYMDSVKIEFPRVGSAEFEEYNIRPYDFCFLFDAQNTEGKKLNNFNQYLDHAANCIYAQSIGPMNKRSNSSEDNTIRELCREQGRNRYAGAGSSMLIYPFEDVKEYIALKWTQECVSKQWMMFDDMYKEKCIANSEMRANGYSVKDADPSQDYIESIDQLSKQKNPFALSIVNSCTIFDDSGLTREGVRWEQYLDSLKKFVSLNASSGQTDLDGQRQSANLKITEISGGTEIWEAFYDAYMDMEKYRAMVQKRCEDTARTIAYAIFKAKNDNVGEERLSHQLETYLLDSTNNFVHPNAARYFLYQALELMKKEQRLTEKKLRDGEKFFDEFENKFDDPKTDDEESAAEIVNRKVSFMNRFNKMNSDQEDLKRDFITYLKKVDEYRINGILDEVLKEGISYIGSLCEAFQQFYTSFDSRVSDVNKKIFTISKKYTHAPGKTARYVCASKDCLDTMVKKMPYMGSAVSIDGKLAMDIYMKVRNFAMLKDKPDNGDYFKEIFEKGIIGYFKSKLMITYGSEVDLDILTALEKEAEYEKGLYDSGEINQYVKHVIQETRGLSNPFIERPLGEQKASISACTFSKKLDPKDDSPRSNLIATELGNFGASPDEDIPLNMIMFYQSIYGLRANGLSKFSPGDANRGPGEYFKAYYELVDCIKPKSDKTPVITPHIDRNWHIVSAMPDLDEANHVAQEKRIYKAFMLGMILDMINYKEISQGKYLYKLHVKNCESEDFVVSNKTPCDHYYEVLDALTINQVVVKDILATAERMFSREISGAAKMSFSGSLLNEYINKIKLNEFGKKGLTLFDLATLLKVSTPAASFEDGKGVTIMRVMFETVYEYMSSMTMETELANEFGRFVYDQYMKFRDNISWYRENWKDNFSGFIDDMIINITEMLEDLELYKLVKEIRDLNNEEEE